MAASRPRGRVPDGGDGVIIPRHLVGLCGLLVKYGAMKFDERNGGSPRMWDLAELKKILDEAEASARGRPSVTLGQARPLYTTRQAAAVMGISERRVRHHAAAGRLIARKRGRDWLIDPGSVRDYRRKEPA